MAEETKPEGEIKPGTPRFHEEKIVFDGAHHPKLEGAATKSQDAWKKTWDAVQNHDALKKEMDELAKAHPEKAHDAQRAVLKMVTNPDASLDKDLLKKVEALHAKHIPAEFSAAKAAEDELKTIQNELRTAQTKHLKGIDLAKIEGHTEANKEAVQNAVNAFRKEANAGKMFGILRSETLGAAFSHNLGKEAWNASKGKTLLKGGGVIVGLGAMYDAAFHGQRKDEQGNRTVPRGALGRWTEFIAGTAVAAGSALGGRRP